MISDFGLSKTEEDDGMMATACGTPGYVGRSMEIVQNSKIVQDMTPKTLHSIYVTRGDKWAFKNCGSRKDFFEFHGSCSLDFSSYVHLVVDLNCFLTILSLDLNFSKVRKS